MRLSTIRPAAARTPPNGFTTAHRLPLSLGASLTLRAVIGSILYLGLISLLATGTALAADLNIQAATNLRTLPISPWAGLAMLAAWSAIALLGGGLRLRLNAP